METILGTILFVTIFILAVVILRLLLRKLWVADIVASAIFGLTGTFAFESPIGVAANLLFMYVLLWTLRRYGFVAVAAGWWSYQFLASSPYSLTAWYSGYTFVLLGIHVAVAAGALWVILSDRRGLATESAA